MGKDNASVIVLTANALMLRKCLRLKVERLSMYCGLCLESLWMPTEAFPIAAVRISSFMSTENLHHFQEPRHYK